MTCVNSIKVIIKNQDHIFYISPLVLDIPPNSLIIYSFRKMDRKKLQARSWEQISVHTWAWCLSTTVKVEVKCIQKPKTDSSILGTIFLFTSNSTALEKLCIQLCHQNIYFVHGSFPSLLLFYLLRICLSMFFWKIMKNWLLKMTAKRSLDPSKLLSSAAAIKLIEPATSSLPWMRSTDWAKPAVPTYYIMEIGLCQYPDSFFSDKYSS